MGALTATQSGSSIDLGGGTYQRKVFTVTPAAASDTVDLSTYFSSIIVADCYLTAGLDAHLTYLIPSISGTTITIQQEKADGATNADNWGSASITLVVTGIAQGV